MQKIRLVNVLLLGIAVSIAVGCNQSLSSSHSQSSPPVTPMSFTSDIAIKQITLQARQEKFSPDGTASLSDRPVGFADVFLQVENLRHEPVVFVVKQIQILDASNHHVGLTTERPMEIRLHPLESSVNDFHLTNKTGFKGSKTVKAVVTYQSGDRTHTVESAAVVVE